MSETRVQVKHHSEATDALVMAEYERARYTIYDLRQGETMQVVLLSRSPSSHTIIFGYHHMVMDGVAFEVFLSDLERAYTGQAPAPRGLQYGDFSEKEPQMMKESVREENISYWQQEFKGFDHVLPLLPVCKVNTRRAMTRYSSTYVEHRLDATTAAAVKQTAKTLRVTPSHVFLGVFRVLLARLTGAERLCIGLADSNRHDMDVTKTVGLFLNMLPLNLTYDSAVTFSGVLLDTRTKVYQALGHAGIAFDDLLGALSLPRSSSNSPLFQAFFDYHQGTQEHVKFADTTWVNADRNPGERAYDITLDVIDGSAGSLVALIGQEYLYGPEEMQKVLDCYLALLKHLIDDPKISVGKASMNKSGLSESALRHCRGPRVDFEWAPTLGHRVQEMCFQFPESVAVRDDQGGVMTYSELEKRATSISAALAQAGVRQNDRVAIFQEPGPDWIASVIGIFWAGAVYVPMVHQNPLPRLAAIAQAAKPKGILVHQATIKLCESLSITDSESIVNVDVISQQSGQFRQNIPVSGQDPAIILFTSGSTGAPKGIKLRHRNLVNHIEGYVKTWNIEREVVLQQSAYSFDLSVGQIFVALAMGGTLVIASQATRSEPAALAELIRREKITWTLLTPSEYSSVLQANPRVLRLASEWKHALACGEPLTSKLVTEFAKLEHSDSLHLYNCYGPAEAIISATMTEIEFRRTQEGDVIPIGSPNANYTIFIVDDECNLVPEGFPGEILIGGCGVAEGYLDDDALTKEKFIVNTLDPETAVDKAWNTMYKTGDMGRLRKDGLFLYEGRRAGDTQVKIRGFRVDLMEIESTLLKAAGGIIAEAIATLRTDEGSQTLVCHVIFARDHEPSDPSAYLNKLSASLPLPSYMIPAMAIPVSSFPKNLHSKTDRSAISKLELPETSTYTSSSVPAGDLSPLELRLIETWRDILPAEFASHFDIDRSTDFFSIGGNSLLLVKLQAHIRDNLDVSVPLIRLLGGGTLGEMAASIQAARSVDMIDWDKETDLYTLDANSTANVAKTQLELNVDSQPPRSVKKTVLLTGAMGYFGAHLLRALLEDDDIETIHCLAVRAQGQSQAEDRVKYLYSSSPLHHQKVHVHVGDLGEPRLGLSRDTAENLAQSADLIIHSGARRSFWDNYTELRGPNVDSTRELLRLAEARRVPICMLSSSGVLDLGDDLQEGNRSVSTLRPAVNGSGGYAASKWASEVMIEKASERLGLPATIYRFTPRQGAAMKRDSIPLAQREALVAATERLGVLPERSTWEGHFDMIHSPSAARLIISPPPPSGAHALEIVHHPGEATMLITDLFDLLEEQLGDKIPVQRMGLLEWVGSIKRVGFDWLFSTHDLTLTRTENGVMTKLRNRR